MESYRPHTLKLMLLNENRLAAESRRWAEAREGLAISWTRDARDMLIFVPMFPIAGCPADLSVLFDMARADDCAYLVLGPMHELQMS